MALYQVVNTCTLCLPQEVPPTITALVQLDRLCVVSGNTVHFISSQESEAAATFEFECSVDAVGWSEDGFLVAVGDSRGVLHFVCPSLQKVLFAQGLPIQKASTTAEVDLFRGIQFSKNNIKGTSDLLVLTADDQVFIFQNLQLSQLKEALLQNDSQTVKQAQSEIKLMQLDLSSYHDGWAASILLMDHSLSSPLLITAGYGSHAICVWQKCTDGSYSPLKSVTHILQGIGVIKCAATTDVNFLITLTNTNAVAVWLLSCLMKVNRWTGEPVKDIVLCQADSGTHAGIHCTDKLCLITEDSGQRSLRIVNLPELEVIYRIAVSPFATLCQGSVTEDSLYFVDAGQETAEKPCLQVKHIVQALPENKLRTLLGQQNFEEAEAFAKKFNLDSELVYESKARVLNDILCRDDSSNTPSLLVSLAQCLDQIKNKQFIVDLVLTSPYPTLETTLHLLQYVKRRLQPANSRDNDTKAVRTKVFTALNKLVTFSMIYGEKGFSFQQWQSFLEGSLLEELRKQLLVGQLQQASWVWRRHQPVLLPQLDSNNLLPLLQVVPESVPSSHLTPWLTENTLPFILQHTPQIMGEFLSWVEVRIRRLELAEKELWPTNALEMASAILEALHKSTAARFSIQATPVTVVDLSSDPHSPLAGLTTLQKELSDLQYLHTSLQCPISLFDYEKESPEAVVFRLLDKVFAAELVATTIRTKVLPYVERHRLQLDAVLLEYIKFFLAQAPRYSSTGLSDTPWEAKAIALLHFIQDRECYVTGCVELLKHVHTSWSESVEALVQECLQINHSSVSMLEKQYKLLQLKKMLYSYGVRDFNFSDASKGLLYVRCILTHDGSSVLADALQVAEMYQLCSSQVYMHYVTKLALQDRLDIAKELLRGLPRKEQVLTAQKAFSWAYSNLQLPFCSELDDPKQYIGSARAAIVCLKFLRECWKEDADNSCAASTCGDWFSFADQIAFFKRLLALQVEYGLFLTPQELSNRKKCQQLFENRVHDFLHHWLSEGSSSIFTAIAGKGLQASKHYHCAMRFCQLLGYHSDQLFSTVISLCATDKHLHKATEVSRMLAEHSPTPAIAQRLLYAAQEVWRNIMVDPASTRKDSIASASELAALATTICHPDDLLDSVELYRLCSLLLAVFSQCESSSHSEQTEDSLSAEASPFSRWKWSPRFREDGLVLEQSSIMASAVQYATALLPLQGEGWNHRLPFQPRHIGFMQGGEIQKMLGLASQLNQLLQDNGHTQLALRCTVQTLGAYSLSAVISGESLTSSDAVLQQGQNIVHSQLRNLVNKVLSSRKIDYDYALSLLLVVPPQQAVEKLQAIQPRNASSYSKVIALCQLAMDYGHIAAQPKIVELSSGILKSAEWGKRLSKYKISFTEAFKRGSQEKAKVISALLRNKEVDLELISHYCRDFGLDLQSSLVSYLRILLTEWEGGYQERALAVIQLIRSSHSLIEQLLGIFMRRVTPYDYDKIAFILENLRGVEQASQLRPEQGLLLLDCLKRYTRITPPSKYEKKWFAEHYLTASKPQEVSSPEFTEVALPTLSQTCLPFHPLLYGIPMEIITPELSKETVGKLTPIAKIVKLPNEDFFGSAIKNIIARSKDPAKREPVAFADVAPLVNKIQDLEFTLKVTKWLAKELQNDADQLEALKVALSKAKQWKEQAQSEEQKQQASEQAEWFQQLLRITQIELLLSQHNLGQPEYLAFSNQGATLIMVLFTDLPVHRNPIPPVHTIAAEIAQIYDLRLEKIKKRLVEQWLPATGSSKQEMDITQMSILEDPTDPTEGEEESEDQLNTKRLIYLLNVPESLETYSVILLNWAKRTSSNATSLSRVRALQILLAIAPTDLIESISGTTISEIRDYMQRALFVSELEALHLTTSLSAFQNCSKEGLVKSLWRNHSHEPRALRLICELCLHYQLFDITLWARILQQLLSLALLPYLRHILRTLASYPVHWNIPSMPTVWQEVVLAPFQEATPPLSPFQREDCVETLKMLYGCPFPLELDLNAVVRAYCGVEMRSHALTAALMIPTPAGRSVAVEAILQGLQPKQVVGILEELSDQKQSTYFSGVSELVYLYLDSSGRHEALLGSLHFTAFVHFLISRKLMDGLLVKTLQVNRVKEAIQLVEMYNSYHYMQSSQLKGIEALKEYLITHGLEGIELEGIELESQ